MVEYVGADEVLNWRLKVDGCVGVELFCCRS